MARDFDGSNDALYALAPWTTATANLTIALWAYPDSSSGEQVLLSNGRDNVSSPWDGYAIEIESGKWTLLVNGIIRDNSNTNVTTGSWTHVAISRGASAWSMYVDGSDAGGITATNTPNTPTVIVAVGAQGRNSAPTFQRYFNGRIAEVACWERELDADEIASLAEGLLPSAIPEDLVDYSPLIGRGSPEPNLVGDDELTVTGATVAAHPRILQPKRRQVIVPASGGGGGATIPIFFNHYQKLRIA